MSGQVFLRGLRRSVQSAAAQWCAITRRHVGRCARCTRVLLMAVATGAPDRAVHGGMCHRGRVLVSVAGREVERARTGGVA